MELNKKVTRGGGQFALNEEGGIAFKERDDKALFLVASAFKLRNSFYYNAKDTLKSLESLIDSNSDFVYKMALAKFLSEKLGIRLSPVIMVTREAIKAKRVSTTENRTLLKYVTSVIMDRPDKIANALAYSQFYFNEFRSLPPFFKKSLRNAFEKFDAYTLRKFKMRRRIIKAADIVKALRPRPRNVELSALYKEIIENRAPIAKDTVITAVLSDVNKSVKDKKAWINENIDAIPSVALVRNMNNVPKTAYAKLEARLSKMLRVGEDGLPIVKVANPFDIMTAGLHAKDSEVIAITDRALSKFVNGVNLINKGNKISFLIDVSGSMHTSGIEVGISYLSLLIPMMKQGSLKLWKFNTQLNDVSNLLPMLVRNSESPITISTLLRNELKANGGTALATSIRSVADIDNPDLIVVISDEITWAEHDTRIYNDLGCKVVSINPAPFGRVTAFAPDANVIKISGLDAKILYYIPFLVRFNEFKEQIKNSLMK